MRLNQPAQRIANVKSTLKITQIQQPFHSLPTFQQTLPQNPRQQPTNNRRCHQIPYTFNENIADSTFANFAAFIQKYHLVNTLGNGGTCLVI
jgi:hypothetical protein